MIVPVSLAVVAARVFPKRSNFANEAGVFQITQRVINRRETDPRHLLAGRVKHLHRGRMLVGLAHYVQYDTSLWRQTGVALGFRR